MNILFAALALFLLYILQAAVYRKYWSRNLDIRLFYSKETCVEGEQANLVEVLTNNKRLPLPNLTVKFQTSRKLDFLQNENSAVTDLYYRSDIFSFKGRERITRTLPFCCKSRSYYTIDQLTVSCSDILFSQKYHETRKIFTQLYVYPKYVDIRKLLIPFNQLYGMILANRHFYEDPFEFRSIREYQPFDPMRAVNWKAFARTGELMVNTYEDTASQEVCIYLNLENNGYENHYDIMEENIRLAATLSDMLITKGIPVSLKTNGCDLITKQPLSIPAGTGTSHQTIILQNLSRISLELPVEHLNGLLEQDLQQNNRSPYALVISNYCHSDFTEILKDILKSNHGSQLIYTYHRSMEHDLKLPQDVMHQVLYWEVTHID